MQFRLTPGRSRRTCVDGRSVMEYTIEPAPDQQWIDTITMQGPVSLHVTGGFTFFRIEWRPDITIKGMLGDQTIQIYTSLKGGESVVDYLNDIFTTQ